MRIKSEKRTFGRERAKGGGHVHIAPAISTFQDKIPQHHCSEVMGPYAQPLSSNEEFRPDRGDAKTDLPRGQVEIMCGSPSNEDLTASICDFSNISDRPNTLEPGVFLTGPSLPTLQGNIPAPSRPLIDPTTPRSRPKKYVSSTLNAENRHSGPVHAPGKMMMPDDVTRQGRTPRFRSRPIRGQTDKKAENERQLRKHGHQIQPNILSTPNFGPEKPGPQLQSWPRFQQVVNATADRDIKLPPKSESMGSTVPRSQDRSYPIASTVSMAFRLRNCSQIWSLPIWQTALGSVVFIQGRNSMSFLCPDIGTLPIRVTGLPRVRPLSFNIHAYYPEARGQYPPEPRNSAKESSTSYVLGSLLVVLPDANEGTRESTDDSLVHPAAVGMPNRIEHVDAALWLGSESTSESPAQHRPQSLTKTSYAASDLIILCSFLWRDENCRDQVVALKISRDIEPEQDWQEKCTAVEKMVGQISF